MVKDFIKNLDDLKYYKKGVNMMCLQSMGKFGRISFACKTPGEIKWTID